MGKIFFIARSYTPNAASDIRYRSLMKGLICNKEIYFVYLLPDKERSILSPPLSNIKVVNLWERQKLRNKLLNNIYFYLNLLRFLFTLSKDDVVVDLACCEILPFLLLKKDVKVYYELSEHPDISLSASRISPTINRFLHHCKRLEGLFVISEALKDYFVEKGINSTRVHVINMVVDESRFDDLKRTESREPYIAYCGTASNNKDGVDQLIKAFSIVSRNNPKYKLLIIGKTPDKNQNFSNLRLVEDLALSDKVIFTGSIPYDKVPQLLVDADILALDRPDNKQAKYGFPTKLGEYLMSGNPVVITRVGDIPLFLKHQYNALIADPDNIDSFASALNWVIGHPEEAKVIGENGRKLALESFNGMKEGQKIISIINS